MTTFAPSGDTQDAKNKSFFAEMNMPRPTSPTPVVPYLVQAGAELDHKLFEKLDAMMNECVTAEMPKADASKREKAWIKTILARLTGGTTQAHANQLIRALNYRTLYLTLAQDYGFPGANALAKANKIFAPVEVQLQHLALVKTATSSFRPQYQTDADYEERAGQRQGGRRGGKTGKKRGQSRK